MTRRELLRRGAASAAFALVPGALAACDPKPSDRSAWRQSFTTPGSLDVTMAELGGWCWFSEARTLISPGGRLYVGSVYSGPDEARNGAIEVTSVDVRGGLRAGQPRSRTTVDKTSSSSAIGQFRVDDHNNPGLEVTAAGGVIAMWSGHGSETLLRTAADPNGSGIFEARTPIERPDSVVYPGRGVSYGTVHRLESAGVILAAYRGEQYSWNILRSTDDGQSWEALGLLLIPPARGERPYAKFSSDGYRLWFATTEGHPRTYQPTRIRVGCIQPDGRVEAADRRPLGTVGNGVHVHSLPIAYNTPASADAWVSEIRFAGGRPVVSVSLRGRELDNAAGRWNHDYLRLIPDTAGGWVRELVAHGGGELSQVIDEPDYSGLIAIDPSTHNRMVVSTNVHPSTRQPLRSQRDGRVHFELWEMNRSADGTSRWVPTPITSNSAEDNIRPHIALRGKTKILSWMRGTYPSPHHFRTSIVSRQSA